MLGHSPGVSNEGDEASSSVPLPNPPTGAAPNIVIGVDDTIDIHWVRAQKEKQRQWRVARTERIRSRNSWRPAPLPVESFPGLPSTVIEEKSWQVTQLGCFRFPDQIDRLEARACLLAMREKLRDPGCHRKRSVHLCDNLGFVLSFSKGRSRGFGTLAVQRKSCCVGAG